MQKEILEAEPEAEVRVYAVWVPFLGGTSQAADVSRRVLPDPRVTQFWDGSALTSEWFAKNVDHSPAPVVSFGGTIIGQSSALQDAITPLLAKPSAA